MTATSTHPHLVPTLVLGRDRTRHLGSVLALCLVLSHAGTSLRASDPASAGVVRLTATASSSPTPQITLQFHAPPPGYTPVSYQISRRTKDVYNNPFSPPIDTVPGTQTTFVDAVPLGSAYEYEVMRTATAPGGGTVQGYGYIYAGVAAAQPVSRGRIVLVVDKSQLTDAAFVPRLTTLENDLTGDGYTVLRYDAERGPTYRDYESPSAYDAFNQQNNLQVRQLRAAIRAAYDLDPASVRAVLLLGHLPVPFAGSVAYDGHDRCSAGQNHTGAWPTDLPYADLGSLYGAGGWSDATVNIPADPFSCATTQRRKNQNVPGDGKFDNADSPTLLQLQVGRVDLSDMLGFALAGETATVTETRLLKKYLEKDHGFRHRLGSPYQEKGLIDGNFPGSRYEDAAWMTFSSLFGPENTLEADWFTTSGTQRLLWAYGNGPGDFQSAGGVGATSPDFAARPSRIIFSSLFGSYFGDWDITNALLRAPLCNDDTLTCFWGNNLYASPGKLSYFGHMGLGEPIGFCAYNMQANGPAAAAHSLMGDPTLRLHVLAPPNNVRATRSKITGPVSVTWTRSADDAAGTGFLGYHVFRGPTRKGPFTLLTPAGPVSGTNYSASAHTHGVYMIRALKLQTSRSGTYTNLSQGNQSTLASRAAIAPLVQKAPPARVTGIALEPVAMTVEAYGVDRSGGEALTYQWQRLINNKWTALADDATFFAGTRTPTLLLRQGQVQHAGSYRVSVANNQGTATNTAVNLVINANAPNAVKDAITTTEGTTLVIPVLANDSDVETPRAELGIISLTHPIGLPGVFATTVNGFIVGTLQVVTSPGQPQQVRFTPNPGFFGTATFSYVVSDGQRSSTAEVTITAIEQSIDPGPPHQLHSLTRYGLTKDRTTVYRPPAYFPPDLNQNYSRELPDGSWELIGADHQSYDFGASHLEHEPLAGDFALTLRVNSVFPYLWLWMGAPLPALDDVQGGLMITEALNHSGRLFTIGVGPAREVYLGVQTEPGAPNAYGNYTRTVLAAPGLTGADRWVGLERRGDELAAYVSSDGQQWIPAAPPIVLPGLTTSLLGGPFSAGSDLTRTTVSQYQRTSLRLANGQRAGNGVFSFHISGGPRSRSATVEASDDLTFWDAVGTANLDAAGAAVFADGSAAASPSRFYRVRSEFVRSVNSLGYVTKTVTGSGFVANPLEAPPNTLASLFPVMPDYTTAYLLRGGQYSICTYETALGGWDPAPDLVVNPGEAVWLQNNSGATISTSIIGEVRQGTVQTLIPAGASFVVPPVPQRGLLQTELTFPVKGDDIIHRFDNAAGQYSIFVFDPALGGWDPMEPLLEVGQTITFTTSTLRTWVRQFSVWDP